MAQADGPYRDERDARIEILEAENWELRRRLGETSKALEISPPVIALSLPEDLDGQIEKRKQIIKIERERNKSRNKSNKLIIDKFLAQLFEKMKKIRQAMRSTESIILFRNEKMDLSFGLDSRGRPFFYLQVTRLYSRIYYLNFWGYRSLRIDLAEGMTKRNISLQEIIESTEKNIAEFFCVFCERNGGEVQ